MVDTTRCPSYMAFSVSSLMECSRTKGHTGAHQFTGTVQSLEGECRHFSVRWTDPFDMEKEDNQ